MIYYKRKRRIGKFIIIPLLIIVSVVFFCLFFLKNAAPVISDISEEEVRAVTSNAVREATMSVLSENSHETPENITYDSEGNISTIQMNYVLINKIVQECGYATQKKLSTLGMRGIDIPLGSLSRFVFLAGKGPTVNIKLFPIGSVHVEIVSKFIAQGINQTNHKIYLSINSDVSIVLPGSNNSISALAEILICDTIIVGKIPSVYLTTSSYGYDFVA